MGHYFEMSLVPSTDQGFLVSGVDEVGRGCIFGSVVAAAVVLPLSSIPRLQKLGIKDSKKLSPKQREELIEPIKETVLGWQIAEATSTEIDEINILQASLLAMKRCLIKLQPTPELCLVDGKFPVKDLQLKQKTVVKGDQLSTAIASASILAKVWRDAQIIKLAEKYPEYDLKNNKGYPTPKHKAAIEKYGITPYHRKSFAPCKNSIK